MTFHLSRRRVQLLVRQRRPRLGHTDPACLISPSSDMRTEPLSVLHSCRKCVGWWSARSELPAADGKYHRIASNILVLSQQQEQLFLAHISIVRCLEMMMRGRIYMKVTFIYHIAVDSVFSPVILSDPPSDMLLFLLKPNSSPDLDDGRSYW